MKPIVRQGGIAPAVLAVATLLVWAIAGSGAALAVLALGAAAIVGFHLYYLQVMTDWASGPLDAPVPEGRGAWAPLFAAMYKRVRMRVAYQRDLREVIARFGRCAATNRSKTSRSPMSVSSSRA